MTEQMTRDVDSCPRCGGEHEDLTMERLANPPEWFGWWSTCPETNQPILTDWDEDSEKQNFDEACAESLVKSIEEASGALHGLVMAKEADVGAAGVSDEVLAGIGGSLQHARSGAQIVMEEVGKE